VASVIDYGAATPSDWTITMSKPMATLTAGGTDSLTIDVAIPTDSAALAGTLKIDATSGVAPVALSSTLNVANQYTLVIPPGTGTAIPHAYTNAPNTLRLRMGASIVFDNQDTVPHRIHGDGGLDHEDAGGGQPGAKYTQTPTGSATWYCHEHNESNAKTYNIQIVQ
jgi:plastocyanin